MRESSSKNRSGLPIPATACSFFPESSDCGKGARGPSTRYRPAGADRKSTRLNSSHLVISYAVFCLKKKKILFTVLWLYLVHYFVTARSRKALLPSTTTC